MTNDEKATDEMKQRMRQYEQRLQVLFEAKTADLTSTLQNVDEVAEEANQWHTMLDNNESGVYQSCSQEC
jgi:hypothetical protein